MTKNSRRVKANAIRALSMDAVQRANSGHPGAPMGMADIAEVLWSDFLIHNPKNPQWVNRDRFVLSNGHGSMLLYSLLHLTGYDLDIDEIKCFRQLHSKTPGHPEYGYTPGVEVTTGPLGQGLCNAIGMAIAERILASTFNQKEFNIVDHHTYVFVGDGCLMEGISHEGCSLAGTLGLGKLIVIYDDNGISIDGEIEGWFTDNTPARFQSYGWHVVSDVDGHDPDAVSKAIQAAKDQTQKPSIICCKTVIGFGSPNKSGKGSSHGAPLGDTEVELVREELGWEYPPFEIPKYIYEAWNACEAGRQAESDWNSKFTKYREAYPDLALEYIRRQNRELPSNWPELCEFMLAEVDRNAENVATRKASQIALEALGPILPELIGGSADLTGSNLTQWSGSKTITKSDQEGNYIFYGVREFGMAAVMNGLALYGAFKPYGGTFLMFSEYARNALRMAALMKQPSIFVFTHDSIGLGEDGPTHQAVEQTATLRMIPRMSVWRPCDAVESMVAWQQACESKERPFSLIFSRQSLPHQVRTSKQLSLIKKGGYILRDCQGEPDVILLATGSEVQLVIGAADEMPNINIRVVSMPSMDRFSEQSAKYRESVLPSSVRCRVAVEAGVRVSWTEYVGLDGTIVSIETFGESAPANDVFEHFGITMDAVIKAIKQLLTKHQE
ncbi:MAG: transketolase [Gammaproteobacteria bacterium]|nr:transketolase [Gammaproteobacteria bacterium]